MTEKELWTEFCRNKGVALDTPYQAWAFGGGGTLADELADLVAAGRKFGTASAYDNYVIEDAIDEIPGNRDYSIILNDNGDAVCVVRNYDVYIRPFGQVTHFHAYSEGEGDCSLGYWRKVHKDFFESSLKAAGYELTDESMVVCEKFALEYLPGHDMEERLDELIFVEPSMNYADEIKAYRQDMLDAGSSFDGCFSLKRQEQADDFVESCRIWSNPSAPLNRHGVRGSVIMAIRKSDGKMVGCFQAHHVLNDRMRNFTGHVGYSVRPDERGKGYAKRLLAKAKDYLASFGFEEIILSCLPDNVASKKTILANGGQYVETVYLEEDGVYLERYRIQLNYV